MKNTFLLAACLLFGGAFHAASAQDAAKFDLSARRAAYFIFKPDGAIDLKGEYVAAGGTITRKKSSATACQGDECQFAVGFILFRDATGNNPVFKVSVAGGKTETLVFGFDQGEKTKMARHTTPPLKIGANKLKVTLDPDNKISETNENNNSFEITVVVEP